MAASGTGMSYLCLDTLKFKFHPLCQILGRMVREKGEVVIAAAAVAVGVLHYYIIGYDCIMYT